MFSVVDDVLEARDYIAQLINKGWFRHAVGERGVKHIITLLRFVDTHYRACSVNVDLDFLINYSMSTTILRVGLGTSLGSWLGLRVLMSWLRG